MSASNSIEKTAAGQQRPVSPKRGLLVRVGIDASYGRWNAPVSTADGRYVYVPIPETERVRRGHDRPYRALKARLQSFGAPLPDHLSRAKMHLDPDFDHLSYGDLGRKGKRIGQLQRDDLLVFYAGLRDIAAPAAELVYALVGLYVVDRVVAARDVAMADWHRNAHTRCHLSAQADDIVVYAQPGVSGRLQYCLPIGSRRTAWDRPQGTPVYRVKPDVLADWGGLSNHDGYLQRSAVPPAFSDVSRFYHWFLAQQPQLVAANWA